jgi:alpha-mannosidase
LPDFLNPPNPNRTFTLRTAEIAVLDRDAWDLYWDFSVILGIAKHLPKESVRAWQATETLRQMMNVTYAENRMTFPLARDIARRFLSAKTGEDEHFITAVGHCHIDTAWLWPFSETRRKCARSWASQIRYMEEYPNYIFVASSAQQYAWVKENYPSLFKRIQEQARNGRFVPTGGTWVEMDCNIPSGESLVRQFLFGQRFFLREFGKKCTEFWLPDTFGYSAQLPQLIRGAGMEFFLTQKLSWNLFNKMPSHTFWWQGLDGSKVISHFPPADTYCSVMSIEEVLKTVNDFKNKDKSKRTLLLFGKGDGGGGPTRDMLERLLRIKDVNGLPKVEVRTPYEFFQDLKKESNAFPVWVGELYFELHQGTYTTQAKNKLNNRRSEFLLRDVEFLATIAMIEKNSPYPSEQLDKIWKLTLLNQFHDVLPGSSIGLVYIDSNQHYAEIQRVGQQLFAQSLSTLLDVDSQAKEQTDSEVIAVNCLSWPRTEVVELPENFKGSQEGRNGRCLGIVHVGSMSVSTVTPQFVPSDTATIEQQHDGTLVLENVHLVAYFAPNGTLVSLIHKATQHEVIDPQLRAGNRFVLFEDLPFFWDAWDVMIYHTEKRKDILGDTASVEIIEKGPLRVSFRVKYKIGDQSSIVQIISLDATLPLLVFDVTVHWYENRKFLKVEFPLNVHNTYATYSTQWGHVQRPTHQNTTWDMAKFEVCGHHWADLSEYGFGVALINDCKYGYSTLGNMMRLSLLRSPKLPDDKADMGVHNIKFALYPHAGGIQEGGVIRHGYQFNEPLHVFQATGRGRPKELSYFTVDSANIIIEVIKKAEDTFDNSVVVRMWESFGGRGRATLTSHFPIKRVVKVNLLEEEEADNKNNNNLQLDGSHNVSFTFHPFEIITIKLIL